MSITLLTAVPGGGKTAYVVWNVIKKAHEDGKVIYTCGIPKLKIPTIELNYEQLLQWHVRDVSGELPKLVNFEHNSILVIDEVQKLWPAQGSKVTQDIKDLSEHRHFGLTFYLVTQSPNLIHRNVLSLVDRHLHIRVNWNGRKIYEWPEYCRNPAAVSNRNIAVIAPYRLPKNSFSLFHSATTHVKPQKRVPIAFYVFILSLLFVSFMAYSFYTKHISPKETTVTEEKQEQDKHFLETTLKQPEVKTVSRKTLEVIDSYPTLVSSKYDWNRIASCVASDTACACYGYSAERLMIPKETCIIATQHGWPSKRARPSEAPKLPEVTSVSTEI